MIVDFGYNEYLIVRFLEKKIDFYQSLAMTPGLEGEISVSLEIANIIEEIRQGEHLK